MFELTRFHCINMFDYVRNVTNNMCNSQSNSTFTIMNANFTNNVATVGGAIHAKGAYITKKDLEPLFNYCKTTYIHLQKCNFESNSLTKTGHGGVAFYSQLVETVGYLEQSQSQLRILMQECTFFNNFIHKDIYGSAAVTLENHPNIGIRDCTFKNNRCTGIAMTNGNLLLQGNVMIVHNNGSAGGGVLLRQGSRLYLRPHTTVTIAHNRAQHAGGGIYVADNENANSNSPCFFQFHLDIIKNMSLLTTTRVHLSNNSALFAGQQLYGGSVRSCHLITNSIRRVKYKPYHYYQLTFKFDDIHQPSYITSNPKQVCHCEDGSKVDCKFKWSEEHYPGERFNISVAVVGQEDGIRPGGVAAEVNARDASLGELQNIQSITESSCAKLQYTIYSKAELVTLVLQPAHPGDSSMVGYVNSHFKVKLLDCPVGFQKQMLPRLGYHCDCVPVLLKHNVTCDITHKIIQRQDQMWIGYVQYRHGNDTHKSVVFHSICPNNYCKSGAVNITSSEAFNQNNQCAFHRTGILCGGCKRNLSAVFGSSNCLECTNNSLFLIIAFASAGVFLVLLLTALNLTVAEGTIHGLLLYGNIIQANADTFFPTTDSRDYLGFLKTFIAWINLDLGIETCFYNGMDALAKALLQFAFPLYIWSISGVIIFLSSRSFRVSKLIGNNAVKVLATLILLSYAKLLRAVLNGLAYVELEFNDANVSFKDRAVWQLDGNVPFADKKHIVLFVTALAIGLIMLPFTLTLLFIQPLQRHSHRRLCCHIRRLMPFFDAYTGAYKHRNRFWPGLLLSTRVILLIIHALNLSSDPKLNMMAIASTAIVLVTIAWLTRQGIYRKIHVDFLEALSIINLGVLCLVTAYNLSAGTRRSQTILTSISVSIALLTFAGVVCYHILTRVRKTRCWDKLTTRIHELRRPVNEQIDSNADDITNYPPFRRFDEEREPLLGFIN